MNAMCAPRKVRNGYMVALLLTGEVVLNEPVEGNQAQVRATIEQAKTNGFTAMGRRWPAGRIVDYEIGQQCLI